MSNVEAPARRVGRPPNVVSEVEVVAEPVAAPVGPRLVEVHLLKKYCPKFLVAADGSANPNSAEIKETIEPGIHRLHHEDAGIALSANVASATQNTFRGI